MLCIQLKKDVKSPFEVLEKDPNEAINSVKSNGVFGTAEKFQIAVASINKNTEGSYNLSFNIMKLGSASL